jgi:hypothetical protein
VNREDDLTASPTCLAGADVVDLLLVLDTLISRAELATTRRRLPQPRSGAVHIPAHVARRVFAPRAHATRVPASLTKENTA